MKTNKNLKLVLIILLIILISMISFGGIYIQNKGLIKNVLPEYKLAKDLKGYRRVELAVSDKTKTVSYDENGNEIKSGDTQTEVKSTSQVKIVPDSDLTLDNFVISKEIVAKRLQEMQVSNYDIRLNKENGTIILELPENDDIDRVVGNIYYQGKFEIVDNNTNEVLMTNKDIEKVQSGYGSTSTGLTGVFINIQFNKEGTEKFANITRNYTGSTDSASTDSQEENSKKEIALKLDDSTLLTTYFSREITNGIMQLTLSTSEDADASELQKSYLEANSLSSLLSSGDTPIKYEVELNRFMYSDITSEQIGIAICASIVLLAIAFIYLVIRYKENGILGSLSIVGFVALLLVTLRYTNVELSIGGIVAIEFAVILDFLLVNSAIKNENIVDTLKRYTLMYVPVLILSVVLTFTNILIGAVLFWSVVIILLYNLIATKLLLK